jgi:hypothetical protein
MCRVCSCLQKDIIFYDNDADFVILDPDWDSLLEGLRARLPRSYRVFYVVPSEDRSIKWIRVMTGVGIMDLVGVPVMLLGYVMYVMVCSHCVRKYVLRSAELRTAAASYC